MLRRLVSFPAWLPSIPAWLPSFPAWLPSLPAWPRSIRSRQRSHSAGAGRNRMVVGCVVGLVPIGGVDVVPTRHGGLTVALGGAGAAVSDPAGITVPPARWLPTGLVRRRLMLGCLIRRRLILHRLILRRLILRRLIIRRLILLGLSHRKSMCRLMLRRLILLGLRHRKSM